MSTVNVVDKFWDRFDMYGSAPPSFNINGSQNIGTSIGFIMTFVTMGFMILYSTIKTNHYMNSSQSLITLSSLPDSHLTDETSLTLDSNSG